MNKILIELKNKHLNELRAYREQAINRAIAEDNAKAQEEFALIQAEYEAKTRALSEEFEQVKASFYEDRKEAIKDTVGTNFDAHIEAVENEVKELSEV